MEWVDDWHGQIVGLDTAPLIYYLEEPPNLSAAGRSVLRRAGTRRSVRGHVDRDPDRSPHATVTSR